MSAKSDFFLLANALTPDAVPLGTLIPAITQPHQDGLPSPPHLTQGSDYLLSRLLQLSADDESGSTHQFAAREAYLYALTKPRRVFVALCAPPDVRDYVREEVEAGARHLFFVTGYCTFVDARIEKEVGARGTMGVRVDVPVGDILLGPGAAAGLADVVAGAGHSHEYEQVKRFTTPGERIYALSYRRVKFQWFSRGDIDKAELKESNCWIMTPDTKVDNDEDAEVVKADLEEVDGEAEGFERFAMPDGPLQFFYEKG
ncbi:MAG: hypothetical protein M1829_003871 [Trizodia sp. TS-e1964]|nr:MAG: hypothetical protein M1829_003871 [Trizodia sp. TS-e1964]